MTYIIRLYKYSFIVILLISMPLLVSGQIIPPGLGKTNAGSWLSLGLNQEIGQNEKWSSTTYIGLGRKSGLEEKNPFDRHAIFVLNQEFKHRFHPKWTYSLAASYRNQDLYKKGTAGIPEDPRFKQEFRIYGRISFIEKIGKLEITPTFRQEVIKYYTPDFKDYAESLRLRSRFRIKASLPVDQDKTHKFSLYSEQLFSVSKSGISQDWESFKYSDSRFSFYYTWSPSRLPLSVNTGYMCNVLGSKFDHVAHYIGVDFMITNIF